MKILIAIPTFETIQPETFRSVYGLEIPKGAVCHFDFVRGYGCATARNRIAAEAVALGYEYVLMVDSDIVLPRHTLPSLLAGKPDVCLGCYPRRNTLSGVMELFKLGQDNYVDTWKDGELLKKEGHFEVKGGGFGCALVKTAILKDIPRPWFKYVEYPDGALLSEDNYFCGQVRATGRTVLADPRVRCGHIGRTTQWR